jgi:DNA/RNA endonuclease YhcR with UshA esterase domain
MSEKNPSLTGATTPENKHSGAMLVAVALLVAIGIGALWMRIQERNSPSVQPAADPAPPPAAEMRLAEIDGAFVGSSVAVSGKVLDLFPPPADSKRPYRLKIADDSGEQTIVFWQEAYDQILGKDVLSGAYVRARVRAATYQNKLQLRLASGADIEILDGPPPPTLASISASAPAATTPKTEPIPAARNAARGRSVQTGHVSVGEVTGALTGQTVCVRGRVESVNEPKAGTRQPYVVVLQDDVATLRVAYWSSANDVIAIKPAPGALFEMEGVVEVYQDQPQLKVKSGYKVKLVDDVPASAPAVDVSMAVAISSIAAADLGQTRVVQGTLGAGRSLKSGVAYPLSDASGTIDLVLWESLIPVDILGQLEEGVQVAATGEVGEYNGHLQIKAAAGFSVMVIP